MAAAVMSMEALDWAVGQRTKSAGARVALLVLAHRANGKGECWPSLERLAADMGMEVRGARRAVAELETAGLVARESRYRQSNVFRLKMMHSDAVPGTTVPGTTVPGTTVPETRHHSAARTDKELKEERSLLRSDAPAAADTSEPTAVAPFDARKLVWTEGVVILRRLTGKAEGAARSLMGKLLSAAKDDCAAVLTALRECPDTRDPVAWLLKAATARGKSAVQDRPGKMGWMNDLAAKVAGAPSPTDDPPTIDGNDRTLWAHAA